MRKREAVRIVPRSPITVALIKEGGVPRAYGVVANISTGGACIWTDDESLEPGTGLSLRLSFPRGSQPLDADGVVVWGEPRGTTPSRRCGLRWKGEMTGKLLRYGVTSAGPV